jgi:hypothetical protein
MHGQGFDVDLRSWFGSPRERRAANVPNPQVPRNLVQQALQSR